MHFAVGRVGGRGKRIFRALCAVGRDGWMDQMLGKERPAQGSCAVRRRPADIDDAIQGRDQECWRGKVHRVVVLRYILIKTS